MIYARLLALRAWLAGGGHDDLGVRLLIAARIVARGDLREDQDTSAPPGS